jgi:dimethylglycine dehydrogenase
VSGTGAFDYLDIIMAGKIPEVGRLSLNPMLSNQGKIIGDFTVAQVRKNVFQLTASYTAQAYHMRWFCQNQPEQGVNIKNISKQRIGFQIAGPKARELLQRVTRTDISNEAFPFLSVKEMEVGQCQAIVQRVSYTGDRGYEIFVPVHHQVALYQIISEAGKDLGLRPFGMRAMMSLRLDKSFGSWMREYKPDYTPLETGLDRFVDYTKATNFIGKAAVLAEKEAGVDRQLCTFIVDAQDADVNAYEPIWHGGNVVGFVTSGGYSHYKQKSIAFGFLPNELATEGQQVEIELLGEMIPAHLYFTPLFDPKNEYLRG